MFIAHAYMKQPGNHNIRHGFCHLMSKKVDFRQTTTASTQKTAPKTFFVTTIVLAISVFVCFYCMGNSASEMANPVVVATRKEATHKATLIFLHGLGDTGHGWAEAFKDLSLPFMRYVCPTAPIKPVTLNGGARMPSWFDIYGLSPGVKQDEGGIKLAAENLKELIDQEKKFNADAKILIGGFSQGGAVALYTALTMGIPLSGVVGLSTWLPLHNDIKGIIKKETLVNLPIFQGHGLMDPLVPFQWGKMTGLALSNLSEKHTFKQYEDMGHSSCSQEMEDVKNFLTDVASESHASQSKV